MLQIETLMHLWSGVHCLLAQAIFLSAVITLWASMLIIIFLMELIMFLGVFVCVHDYCKSNKSFFIQLLICRGPDERKK